MYAQIGRTTDTDADDGRRAGFAASFQHAVDDKGFDRINTVGRDRHLQPRIIFGAAALWNHLDRQRFRLVCEFNIDDGDQASAGSLRVLPRHRMHHRGAKRMFFRGAFAALDDGLLQGITVKVDSPANDHVVDWNTGVLTQKIIGVLGHFNVAQHGTQHRLSGCIGFALFQAGETLLDIGRQQFERADISLLGRVLDVLQIDFHHHCITPPTACARAQFSPNAPIQHRSLLQNRRDCYPPATCPIPQTVP